MSTLARRYNTALCIPHTGQDPVYICKGPGQHSELKLERATERTRVSQPRVDIRRGGDGDRLLHFNFNSPEIICGFSQPIVSGKSELATKAHLLVAFDGEKQRVGPLRLPLEPLGRWLRG